MKLDGQDVPVKLKVFNSMFVPLAKWSMLLTGNYRCITPQEPRSIRDAVHGDINLSQSIYHHVDAIAQRLGADPADQVPFEKYAKAAESLLKPSSAARAVAGGSPSIERVDLLVKLISHQLGAPNAEIDRTVQIVNQKLNESIRADASGGTARRSNRRDVEPRSNRSEGTSGAAFSALATPPAPVRWHRGMLMPLASHPWPLRVQFRVAARQNRRRDRLVPPKAHL